MRTVWEKYTTELYTMQLRVAWTGSLGWVGLNWVRSYQASPTAYWRVKEVHKRHKRVATSTNNISIDYDIQVQDCSVKAQYYQSQKIKYHNSCKYQQTTNIKCTQIWQHEWFSLCDQNINSHACFKIPQNPNKFLCILWKSIISHYWDFNRSAYIIISQYAAQNNM